LISAVKKAFVGFVITDFDGLSSLSVQALNERLQIKMAAIIHDNL